MAENDDFGAPTELLGLLEIRHRREPAVVEIAIWVARAVVDGTLSPGQDLNSVDLANRFGTSRTPVREALALLESEGLVEMRARRRPRVASFTREQVNEIFYVRAHLMSPLARSAVLRATDEDIVALEKILVALRRFASAGDDDRYRWAHFAYFDLMVDISGNMTAKTILNSLFLRSLSVRRALSRPDRLVESLEYAEQIQSAFLRRDEALAALLVMRSFQAAVEALHPGEHPF